MKGLGGEKEFSKEPPSPSWRHERYWVDQASLIFYCLELFCRACFWKCLETRRDKGWPYDHYFQGFRERTLTGSFLQSGCDVVLPCNWSSLGFVQQTGPFCQWRSTLCPVRCFLFFFGSFTAYIRLYVMLGLRYTYRSSTHRSPRLSPCVVKVEKLERHGCNMTDSLIVFEVLVGCSWNFRHTVS